MFETYDIESREQWLALREPDVTASTVGALLGVHDYQTALGLYLLKSGELKDDVEESPPMRRGRLLEPVHGQLLAEQFPHLTITKCDKYFRDPSARLGATPDFFALDPERGMGVIQTKSVEQSVFRRKWIDPDTREITPPLWIVAQAITEAHLTGAKWAAVSPMVVGFGIEAHLVEVPIHRKLIDRIYSEVAAFWQRIADKNPPSPDFEKDGAIINRMYADTTGEIIDLPDDDGSLAGLVAKRAGLKAREADGSAAEKERKAIDTQLIAKLQNAEAGRLPDGTIITAKTTKRDGYTVAPTSFRSIRIKS